MVQNYVNFNLKKKKNENPNFLINQTGSHPKKANREMGKLQNYQRGHCRNRRHFRSH